MPTAPRRPCTAPRCAAYAVRRGRCLAHQQDYERQRGNVAVRRWYRTTRWAALRQQVLRAQPVCIDCEREGVAERATDIDHITPHGGDSELFWNVGNLQPLCQRHHSAKTRREQMVDRGVPKC